MQRYVLTQKFLNMKKIYFLASLFLLSFASVAQDEGGFRFERERVFTGGNLGMQFGNYTVIDISPQMGYFFNDRFAAGIGAIYQYFGHKDKTYPVNSFQTHFYGGRTFARLYFFESVFAHAEYEVLSLETKYFDPYNLRHQTPRFWVSSVLLGGGYRQFISEFSSINLMVLWNINETVDTPYRNPIIRMGFDIGF